MNNENITLFSVMTPSKKIFDAADVARFRASVAYRRLRSVLDRAIDKVRGCSVPPGALDPQWVTAPGLTAAAAPAAPAAPLDPSDPTAGVLAVLLHLNGLVDATPPQAGLRRFGNLAARTWHERVAVALPQLMAPLAAPPEAEYYLAAAFGLPLRLDYGTGHELLFLAFLGGLPQWLDRVSGLQLLAVFAHYYDLARKLIVTYNLEPAGLHGVWGLDDHFHLIYILGAAQFNRGSSSDGGGGAAAAAAAAPLAPLVALVLTPQCIAAYKLTNLYVSAIAFIHRIKRGPFNEHSPILYDIHTTVTLWSKVLTGLVKMYEVEVLGKFPVVQHFWFGELYPWVDADGNPLAVYEREDEPRPTAWRR